MTDEYRVYLYRLDIDENGVPLPIETNSLINQYLLSFYSVFDRVILQSSAFFKRPGLSFQLKTSPDIFRIIYKNRPCISAYRGVGEEGHEQYLDSRYRTLSGTSAYNPEYISYENNHAKKLARKLDTEFSLMNNQRAIYSTDQVFRNEAASIDAGVFPAELPNAAKVCDIIREYAKNEDVFQTFYVLEQVQRRTGLNSAGVNLVGHQLRHCYFQANAIANECLSVSDFHVQYGYVKKYLSITGLQKLIEKPHILISPQPIVRIKAEPCYQVLQRLYFALSVEDIDLLYKLHKDNKRFYCKHEFVNFCCQRGLDEKLYIKAFKQLHEICAMYGKDHIYNE